MTDTTNHADAIQQMVDRFLGWKLPADFSPDCGIHYAPLPHPNSWPIGTNLLTATQAKAMLEYVAGPALDALTRELQDAKDLAQAATTGRDSYCKTAYLLADQRDELQDIIAAKSERIATLEGLLDRIRRDGCGNASPISPGSSEFETCIEKCPGEPDEWCWSCQAQSALAPKGAQE